MNTTLAACDESTSIPAWGVPVGVMMGVAGSVGMNIGEQHTYRSLAGVHKSAD